MSLNNYNNFITIILSLDFIIKIENIFKEIPQETQNIIFPLFYNNYKFYQELINFPKNLTYLTLGIYFNQKIDNLPQTLTHLTFKGGKWVDEFNQKIDNLPKNLIYLKLGYLFNQKIDKLPKNLTHLTIGSCFKKCSRGSPLKLPKYLTYLAYYSFIYLEYAKAPQNLTTLIYGPKYKIKTNTPKTVKNLYINSNHYLINDIPEHIEKIYIRFNDDKNYHNNKKIDKIENLPLTIKEIVIEKNKHKQYLKIPFGCILTIKKFELLI
jgi:hypothetical protein